MGVRILEGRQGNAVFYCSTSDWAFGPLMEDAEEAELFLRWMKDKGLSDPRLLDHDNRLESIYYDFRCWKNTAQKDGES